MDSGRLAVCVGCRGYGTVHRNVRDRGDESEEPSRVKIVFGF
jgi:hypothetical protein